VTATGPIDLSGEAVLRPRVDGGCDAMVVDCKKPPTATAESDAVSRAAIDLPERALLTASTTVAEDTPSYIGLAGNTTEDHCTVRASDNAAKAKAIRRVRKRGHARPLPLTLDLNKPGRLRVGHVTNLFAISHAGLYQRMRDGRFPQPDGRDGCPFWNTSTILAELEK